MRYWIAPFFGLALGACVVTAPAAHLQRCETAQFTVEAEFPSGGMAGCNVVSETQIAVSIEPEDAEINPSPWYAVRVTPQGDGARTLVLNYSGFEHRYWPKYSLDGKAWTALPPEQVEVARNRRRATLQLPSVGEPYYIAAQEIVGVANYERWTEKMAGLSEASTSEIGLSEQGRPIAMLSTHASVSDRKTVMLVGRQHPPEVTGALAMRKFSETVLGESYLARRFRKRFDLVIVPNMNPDGVELGHWRHNTGGVDLNRDWGPFTQAETQAVKAVIDEIDAAENNQLVLFLDFHSTQRNVFYTQTIEDEPTPYDFTGSWLGNARARLPDYMFERAERHNTDLPTSKNYIHGRFDIPAITYELGDETDRGLIERSAVVFAEEMMKLLLANE